MKLARKIVERAVLSVLLMTSAVYVSGKATAKPESQKIRVALFLDRGAHPGHKLQEALETNPSFSCKAIYGNDIRDGSLRGFDFLVFPGGSGRMQSADLGDDGRAEVKRFVSQGGLYMGICAGSYLASSARQDDLALIPLKTVDPQHWQRGKATLPIEFTPQGQEVFGTKREASVLYHDGPVFARPKDPAELNGLTPLCYFRDEIVAPGGEPGVMTNAPAMVLGTYGQGMVLAISPHPEGSPGLESIELHAIQWMYDHREIPSSKTSSAAFRKVAYSEARSQSGEEREAQQPLRTDSGDVLGERAAALAHEIFEQATDVHYEHKHRPAGEQIERSADGEEARTDCSGFVSYIVHTIAKQHYAVVRSMQPAAPYPQAKTWARFFCSLSPGYPQNGWMRVPTYHDLRRGDLIAWTKAKTAEDHAGHGNTGHVMMVYGTPGAIQQDSLNGENIRYVNVPVIDASSVYHFPPEELPPQAHQQHRDGLGMGCVRILISQNGEPVGYWEGSYWGEGGKPIKEPHMSSEIGFARMVHLKD